MSGREIAKIAMYAEYDLKEVDKDLLETLSESPYVQENWGRKPLTKRSLKKHLNSAVERARFTGAGKYDLGIKILKEKAEVQVTYDGVLFIEYSGEFEDFGGTTQSFYSLLVRDLENWKGTEYTIELKGKNIHAVGFLAFDDANRKANEFLRKSKTSFTKENKMKTANSIKKAVKLLQSAEYTTSKLDDIYDFLYASYVSGEAEQMHDERKVKKALRHYEELDGEMEYKSKRLNKRLDRMASIKKEIREIKAQLKEAKSMTISVEWDASPQEIRKNKLPSQVKVPQMSKGDIADYISDDFGWAILDFKVTN